MRKAFVIPLALALLSSCASVETGTLTVRATGGEAITSYTVVVSEGEVEHASPVLGVSSSFSVTGLPVGLYTVRGEIIDADGEAVPYEAVGEVRESYNTLTLEFM